MANAKLVAHQWNGDELLARAGRATGRGLIGIGTAITSHAKVFVHGMSGDLRRSIHLAKPASSGTREARTGSDAKMADDIFLLEVGSWIDYACVEEVGRGHQFMQPAVETVSGPEAYAVMKRAWMEEGL